MVTLFLLVAFLIVGGLIYGYEKYQKASYIAKAIDGNAISGNYMTEDTQNIVSALKEPGRLKLERYVNAIRLPDGQRISYLTDSMERFKQYSNLNYEPTPTEWQILRGVVKKLYSSI